jgi:outer membrane cobalamin receptor
LTSVFLRGANSQHTKVLLDGIPLNDPSNASRLCSTSARSAPTTSSGSKCLRGPQSMVYGSDAIGGVINIVTIRGEGPLAVRASGYGGSFNTGKAGLSVRAATRKSITRWAVLSSPPAASPPPALGWETPSTMALTSARLRDEWVTTSARG